jgi:hypothetical protein
MRGRSRFGKLYRYIKKVDEKHTEVVRESSAVNFSIELSNTYWNNMKLELNAIISNYLKCYGTTMVVFGAPLTQLGVILPEARLKFNADLSTRVVLPKGRSFNIKSLVYKFYIQQPNWEFLQVGEFPVYINVYKKNNYDTEAWKNQYRIVNQPTYALLVDSDAPPYLAPVSPTVYHANSLLSYNKLTPINSDFDTLYKSYYSSPSTSVGSAIKINEEFYFNGRKANHSRWQLYSHNKVVFHNPSYASEAKYGYPCDFTVSLPAHKLVLATSLTNIFMQGQAEDAKNNILSSMAINYEYWVVIRMPYIDTVGDLIEYPQVTFSVQTSWFDDN